MMSDEKAIETNNPRRWKIFAISAAFGLAAMLLFLGIYGYFHRMNKSFFEGAGTYKAYASQYDGVMTKNDGESEIILDLFSNGRCVLTVGDSRRSGTWNRDREKMYLVCGKIKYAGTFQGDRLTIRDLSEDGAQLILTCVDTLPFVCPKGLPGYWLINSAINGNTVYEKALLNKAGYGGSFVKINYDGSGKANIAGESENDIIINEDTIEYNGMLLSYSFDGSRLLVQYGDGVVLTFKK